MRECVIMACTLVHNVQAFASVKLLVCDSVNDLSCIILPSGFFPFFFFLSYVEASIASALNSLYY